MDAESHLPLRRSWQWRDPLYQDKNTDAEEYDNYHDVEGIPTAFTISRYHNGDETNQRFLDRAGYNIALPADAFDADKAAGKIANKEVDSRMGENEERIDLFSLMVLGPSLQSILGAPSLRTGVPVSVACWGGEARVGDREGRGTGCRENAL